MKKITSIVMGIALATALQALAQDQDTPQSNDRRPPSRDRQETLTAEQVATVKQILSQYDANALTAEIARAIHASFRDAGLRGGPAMHDAIVAAGFDPEKLRELAPPPRHNRPAPNQEDAQGQDGTDRPAPQD